MTVRLDMELLQRISSRLIYDKETGLFTWRIRTNPKAPAGAIAGKLRKDGYRTIGIDGKIYYAHRLAFLWVHGRYPAKYVDHINGNRDDNRAANLREADTVQNNANQKRRIDNRSGFKGVAFHRQHGLWRARIKSGGKTTIIGYFKTPEEAHEAYKRAASELFQTYGRSE